MRRWLSDAGAPSSGHRPPRSTEEAQGAAAVDTHEPIGPRHTMTQKPTSSQAPSRARILVVDDAPNLSGDICPALNGDIRPAKEQLSGDYVMPDGTQVTLDRAGTWRGLELEVRWLPGTTSVEETSSPERPTRPLGLSGAGLAAALGAGVFVRRAAVARRRDA